MCPFVLYGLITDNKKHGLLWVVSFGVVLWCLVSPIERKYRRLQAGCLSSLLRLFCRALFVCLSRWGLLCNINYFYLWPPSVSCNNMLLLSFSWSRGFRVQMFFCIPPLWWCISPLGQNMRLSLFGLSVPFSCIRPLLSLNIGSSFRGRVCHGGRCTALQSKLLPPF